MIPNASPTANDTPKAMNTEKYETMVVMPAARSITALSVAPTIIPTTPPTTLIKTASARNWNKIIEKLNRSPRGELKIRMGSPGSAQVTRCRLLAEWSNLEATTVGPVLILRLK